MKFWFTGVLIVCASSVNIGQIQADSAVPALTHNPFNRPNLVAAINHYSNDKQSLAWPYNLRATMRAGPESLVNIDGRLVAIGEEYEEYRLMQVGDGVATFQKNGLKVTVAVNQKDAEKDEN